MPMCVPVPLSARALGRMAYLMPPPPHGRVAGAHLDADAPFMVAQDAQQLARPVAVVGHTAQVTEGALRGAHLGEGGVGHRV